MSGDWQRGDIAQCIYRGPWGGPKINAVGPRYLQILEVSDVYSYPNSDLIGLIFKEFSAVRFDGRTVCYGSYLFRKISRQGDGVEIERKVQATIDIKEPAPCLTG